MLCMDSVQRPQTSASAIRESNRELILRNRIAFANLAGFYYAKLEERWGEKVCTSHAIKSDLIHSGMNRVITDEPNGIVTLASRFSKVHYTVCIPKRLDLEKLRCGGFRRESYSREMAVNIEDLPPLIGCNKDISINTVKADAELKEWAKLIALGYKTDFLMDGEMRTALKEDKGNLLLYLAKDKEQAAAASFIYIHEDTAVLYLLTTHPDMRLKGIAKSLITEAIKTLKEKGVRRLAFTTSGPQSSSICAKYKFYLLNEYYRYIHPIPQHKLRTADYRGF